VLFRSATCDSLASALPTLQTHGFRVSALDMAGTKSVFDYVPPHRCLVVIGAETEGISQVTRDTADELLSIPISDKVESLNAAVAASIVCFAVASRPTHS